MLINARLDLIGLSFLFLSKNIKMLYEYLSGRKNVMEPCFKAYRTHTKIVMPIIVDNFLESPMITMH